MRELGQPRSVHALFVSLDLEQHHENQADDGVQHESRDKLLFVQYFSVSQRFYRRRETGGGGDDVMGE